MKTSLKTMVILGASTGLLAACGGGGGSSDGSSSTGGTIVTAPSASAYTNFSSTTNADANVSGTIGIANMGDDGSGNQNGQFTNAAMHSVSGTVNPGANGVNVTFDSTNITASGTSSSNTDYDYWEDGSNNWLEREKNQPTDYVKRYSYSTGGNQSVVGDTSISMFLGFATEASHMPTSGTATYNGYGASALATGSLSSGTQSGSMVGTSQVTANFGAGTVNTTVTGTEFYDGTGNFSTAAGVGMDQVSLTGANMSGSSFSGGTITASLSGSDVTNTLIGSGVSTQSSGHFYGWDDTNSTPDEVVGLGFAEGSTGLLTMEFIAD